MATIMQRPRASQPNDASNVNSSDTDHFRTSVPRLPAAAPDSYSASPLLADNTSSTTTTTTTGNAFHKQSTSAANSPSLQLGMFGHGLAAADHAGPSRLTSSDDAGTLLHQHYPYPQASSSSSVSSAPASSSYNVLNMYGEHPLTAADVEQMRAAEHANVMHDSAQATGIFDDPAILALIDQPYHANGQYEPDVEREMLAAMQGHPQPSPADVSAMQDHSHLHSDRPIATSSAASTTSIATPHHSSSQYTHTTAPPSSSFYPSSAAAVTTATPALSTTHSHHTPPTVTAAPSSLAEFDLTSIGGVLQFPELPASLLDQAPEYEYSTHTQANVFDAVQDYQGAGHDEAARIFGLDNYDSSLHLTDVSQGVSAAQQYSGGAQAAYDFWRGNESMGVLQHHHQQQRTDLSAGSHFAHHSALSGDGLHSSFTDASPLMSSSEYGLEASSAPTSRGSDWKLDSAGALITSSAAMSMAGMGGAGSGGVGGLYGNEMASPSAKRRRENSTDANSRLVDNRPFYLNSTLHQQYSQPPLPPPPPAAAPAGSFKAVYGAGQPSFDTHTVNSNAAPMANANAAARQQQMSREPMVPSQGVPHTSQQQQHGARLGSNGWNVGGAGNHSEASPRVSADSWQTQMPVLSVYSNANGNSSVGQYGVTTFNAGGGASVHHHSHADDREGEASDMINALGNAIDASIETEGVAKCPYPNCSKTFAKNRSYNLKAHLRSHSQLKPFQCIHCPRAFSRKHDLERHTRVHSGDKPYLCEACGKGFPRSDALRRHWRVEKECGDKAVEIEAKQPLPSLPPGVNMPAAQAKGPVPGMMHFGAPMTTAAASSSSMGLAPGVNPFLPMYSAFGHPSAGNLGGGGGGMSAVPMAPPGWDSSVPTNNAYANTYAGMGDRKRMREEL